MSKDYKNSRKNRLKKSKKTTTLTFEQTNISIFTGVRFL